MDQILKQYNQLRPYQKEGVQFFLERECALMADEMGLGKTVQTSVALSILFQTQKIDKVLIVCPSSLTYNWFRELERWCPNASVGLIKGSFSNRKAFYLLPYQVWIASYEQITNDVIFFVNFRLSYDLVILDEAQRIKNKDSKISQACKLLSRKMSWALSGTPLENSIEDLISVFSFIKMGLINVYTSKPEINSNISPYFLRRTKFDVLQDIPEILEQNIYLQLDDNQKYSYDLALYESRNQLSNESNISTIFAIINILKQICNFDPSTGTSVKYEALKDIINKAKSSERKILVFSQYVETLNQIKTNIYETFLFDTNIFHGGLSQDKKDEVIANFEASVGFNILLISLKAGGVGLNLNSASIVVLYDRWWNPAIEKQAIHRAHRFGKKEPLNVIKFIISQTIEEKIEDILYTKQALFNSIIEDIDTQATKLLSKEELITILKGNNY